VSDSDSGALPCLDLTPEERLERLLEASRGLELRLMPGAGLTRLSRFTLKQMSRKLKRVPKGSKRAGLVVRRKRRKQHYLTRRKAQRKEDRSCVAMYTGYRLKYKERWQMPREDWDVLWEYVKDRRFTLRVYPGLNEVRLDSVYCVDNNSGERLWEGLNDRLRELGACI
jgi:hypothetical protein